VWDPDGRFPDRCNTELVDLEAVGEHDEAELRDLVAEHARRTASPVARRLLAGWDAAQRRFVKVMPRDYKRALTERAAREAEKTVVASGTSSQVPAGASS
jgi:glutamate synthase domain-containing protein 3